MQRFIDALVSAEKSPLVPDECDYWGALIGSWDLDYVEARGTPKERHVAGEWHFARVLEGLGIEDIFICPARAARTDAGVGEYGATLRLYNPQKRAWDMVYGCRGSMSRFTGTKEGGRVVLTNNHRRTTRWVFTDIAADRFHWQNESVQKDGTVRIWCEVFATRQAAPSQP